MNDVPPESPQKAGLRRLLWWVFWFVVLTTPVIAVFMPVAVRRTPLNRFFPMVWIVIGSIVTGISGAAFIFAWLTGKSMGSMILRGLCCAIGIFILYVSIAYAGCAGLFR